MHRLDFGAGVQKVLRGVGNIRDWSCESSQSRDSQHLVDLPGVCKREDKAVQSLPLLPFRFLWALVFSFLRQRLPLAEAVIHLGQELLTVQLCCFDGAICHPWVGASFPQAAHSKGNFEGACTPHEAREQRKPVSCWEPLG